MENITIIFYFAFQLNKKKKEKMNKYLHLIPRINSICPDIKQSNFSYRNFSSIWSVSLLERRVFRHFLNFSVRFLYVSVSHFCVSWFEQTVNVIERIIQVYGVTKPLHRVSRCKNKASTSRLLRMRHKVAESFGFSISFSLFSLSLSIFWSHQILRT